jgi:AcrR family transcriptional regulator
MNATRRRQHQDQFRAEILDAARLLFSRHGYESFSMRMLAGALGCSHGNIYLYFKNKDELFECLVEESFARLFASLQGLASQDPEGAPIELLKRAARVYIDFGLENPDAYKLAFIVAPSGRARPWRPHPAYEFLRSLVRRSMAEYRFRPMDVDTAAQALWAAVHGVTSLLIFRPSFPWVARQKLVQQVVESAVQGLLISAEPANEKKPGRSHAKRNHRKTN